MATAEMSSSMPDGIDVARVSTTTCVLLGESTPPSMTPTGVPKKWMTTSAWTVSSKETVTKSMWRYSLRNGCRSMIRAMVRTTS